MHLTRKNYNVIKNQVKVSANLFKVDVDDMLSYVHEKIVNYLDKYDPTFGITYNTYLRTYTKYLCMNYLRDDQGMIKIPRKDNYITIKEQAIIRDCPALGQVGKEEELAKALGLCLQEYSAKKFQEVIDLLLHWETSHISSPI